MNGSDVLAALRFPPAARVDRRIPKTLAVEHGASTPSDKRLIQQAIEHIHWVAILKPSTVGIAAHEDATRSYLELAVLQVAVRDFTKGKRLAELLHRAIPYPIFALLEGHGRVMLSMVHKRLSLGEAGKMVLEGEMVAPDAPRTQDPFAPAFASALAIDQQPNTSILTLYQGWMDVLLALDAAQRTGTFEVCTAPSRRAKRLRALQECTRLEAEIARLKGAAAKEKHVRKRIDLNLRLQQARSALLAAQSGL